MKIGDKVFYFAINSDGTFYVEDANILGILTSTTERGVETVFEVRTNTLGEIGRLPKNRAYTSREDVVKYVKHQSILLTNSSEQQKS